MTKRTSIMSAILSIFVMTTVWHLSDIGVIPTDSYFHKLMYSIVGFVITWVMIKLLIPKEVAYS